MSSPHTPGPWHFEEPDEYGHLLVTDQQDVSICRCYQQPHDGLKVAKPEISGFATLRPVRKVRVPSGSSCAPSPMEKTLPRREHNFVREQTDDDDDEHDADNLVHGI